MIKQNRSTFVVFGCGDKANRGVIAGKFRGMWGLKVLELADRSKYERGDTFEIDDVAGEYFTMYFAKKESVDCLIWDLQRLKQEKEKAAVCTMLDANRCKERTPYLSQVPEACSGRVLLLRGTS